MMADIKTMFHQVRVPADNSDLLRFLWWPTGDFSQNIEEYRKLVHLFGATSSPIWANFALRRCAEDNRDSFNLVLVATEAEAIELYRDL